MRGRLGRRVDALAALGRAISLDRDNGRHHVRLAYAAWGEERRTSARRTLELLPGNPWAYWLMATVSVARGALDLAERHVDEGLSAVAGERERSARSAPVALHWLKGLLCLARGASDEATTAFERELALEGLGHVYAREIAANTWYAIGALRLGRGSACGETTGAVSVITQALASAPAGSAGWLLPIEPLVNVSAAPEAWKETLAQVRERAG